jgi:glycosyltransferase involved in cell wall biosynthesis
LNIKKNDFVYLYLGFIKPYKGIEDLITNFKKLNIANKKLLIAGKIFNESYFQKIFSSDENILFVNKFIKNDELQYFFKSANVIVLPFKKVENSGSAILAMGFKKVVIAPKIGVLQHRLKNQKNYLFEEGDLLSKLQLSFDNQDSLDEYGQLNFLELEKHNWFDFSKYFI